MPIVSAEAASAFRMLLSGRVDDIDDVSNRGSEPCDLKVGHGKYHNVQENVVLQRQRGRLIECFD